MKYIELNLSIFICFLHLKNLRILRLPKINQTIDLMDFKDRSI